MNFIKLDYIIYNTSWEFVLCCWSATVLWLVDVLHPWYSLVLWFFMLVNKACMLILI